jgi:4a-hydroxytetrahydrobiopterin dehydratase
MSETPTRLSDEQIQTRLGELPAWNSAEGKLTRTFEFEDFRGAMDFANRIAEVAEKEGHHPDLLVGWGKVVVYLTTHSAGGISENDLKMAALIQRL